MQLLVDCGDFGSTKTKAQTLKVEYLLKGMSQLNYAAINLAEKDLQYGHEFLEQMRDRYHLPFVSANVYYAGTNKLFAKPYIIKKIKGIKFGIFGVTKADGVQRFVSPGTGFKIKDPVLAAQAAVDYLKSECDVIIALSHLAVNGSLNLARKVEGIDIIISGHNGNHLSKMQQVGKTVIMQPGSQGKYLGQFDFVVSSKSISTINGKTVALNDKIPGDPVFEKLMKEYDEKLLSIYPMQSPKALTKYSRYSVKSCSACHLKEYKQWHSTRHSIAWHTLVEKKQAHNPECQQCHTTSYNEANGFTTISNTPDMVNVQCLACHKLSGNNILTHIRRFNTIKRGSTNNPANGKTKVDFKPISEQICLKCHNEDNSPDFKYEEFVTRVSH